MDTKLKRSSRPLFITTFCVCVLGFLTSIVCCLGAMRVNSLTEYLEFLGIADGTVADNGIGNTAQLLYDTRDFGISEAQLERFAHQFQLWLGIAIAATIIFVIAMVYLVSTAGDRDEEGRIILNGFDKLFTEVQLVVIAGLLIGGGSLFINDTYDLIGRLAYRRWIESSALNYSDLYFKIAVTLVLGLTVTAFGLALILSCIKKIKAEKMMEYSLIVRIYQVFFCSGSTMRKVVLVAICICCLSATMFLAPVILIVILVFAPKWVHKYDNIVKGIQEVNSGNLDYKIPVEGDDELDQLAQGINRISEATSIAVENEVKNQRMKTDLISNVSHDLKTPLTSMVTYIDLLKTEGLDSENAPQYVDILEQKTNQLRQLTEDLFEAAKASSGAIPVRMEKVDLLSLVKQGLGEMNERMEAAGLEVVLNSEKDRYMVNADGQLLWRVVENLLSNVIKYSHEGTRVYMNVKEIDSMSGLPNTVFLEIKNISKYSLNIDPSELTERFKRGDESRTTEGSGLGLAIAKDLMKLMEGWLELDIDGDLFKAKVIFVAAEEEDSDSGMNVQEMNEMNAPGTSELSGLSEMSQNIVGMEQTMQRVLVDELM